MRFLTNSWPLAEIRLQNPQRVLFKLKYQKVHRKQLVRSFTTLTRIGEQFK